MRSILSFTVRFVAANAPNTNTSTFGGLDPGDDNAALLDVARKPVSQFASDGTVREFDFRQYLFARQALVRKLSLFLSCGASIFNGTYTLTNAATKLFHFSY